MPTSFFHGVTVTLIDTGPRPIAIPSSSIVGLVDTYTPAEGLAEPNKPIWLTSYREAVKWPPDRQLAKPAAHHLPAPGRLPHQWRCEWLPWF